MGTNAITYQLPNKDRQLIIFGIQIGVPVFNKNKKSFNSMAVIDTGATGSSISQRFAISAQLKAYKRTKIYGFDKVSIVPVYIVDIMLPNGIEFINVKVAQFNTKFDFDCIIGMDILRKGDMALTNANNEMVFTFRVPPSDTHIDFQKQ